tara:strand:- start:1414 stop:2112 length:699 start_codon:yes stop_codon:yes gene_type:complete
MKKEIKEKLDVLDPKFRKQIEDIFDNVNVSVSMLYDAATQDKKTGVYNHNFFQSIFKIEFGKAKRGLQKLSFFIIDIDFFKKINDKYGHVQADELLKQLAKILKKSVRNSDIVARFGGEEFVILLTETDLEKAKEITSRIREAIKEDKFLKKHKLTVSGGLTEYVQGDTIKKIMTRADKALYDAKESGRDRLVAIGLKGKGEFNIQKKGVKKMKKIKKANNKQISSELKKAF